MSVLTVILLAVGFVLLSTGVALMVAAVMGSLTRKDERFKEYNRKLDEREDRNG